MPAANPTFDDYMTPEQAALAKKKQAAAMQNLMAPLVQNPQGSIGGLTEQQYKEGVARANAQKYTAKAEHSMMDPIGHQIMFGPIAPGQGGLGGGVIDTTASIIGPAVGLKMLPKVGTALAEAHKGSQAVNNLVGAVANRALGMENAIGQAAIKRMAVGGYKNAFGNTPQDQASQVLSLARLASLFGR